MEIVGVVNLMEEFTTTFGGKPDILKTAVVHIREKINLDFLSCAQNCPPARLRNVSGCIGLVEQKEERRTSGAKMIQDKNY